MIPVLETNDVSTLTIFGKTAFTVLSCAAFAFLTLIFEKINYSIVIFFSVWKGKD